MPIDLEILSLLPITYKQCSHCENFYDQSGIGQQVHDQILSEYPPDMLEDHDRLVNLVVELMQRYEGSLAIHIIDPLSVQGILKSLRHRISKYPAFIVDHKNTVVGWNLSALNHLLESSAVNYTPHAS